MDYAYINPLTQNREVAIEYIKDAFSSQNKGIKYLLNPCTGISPVVTVKKSDYRKLLETAIFLLETGDYMGADEYVLHETSLYIQSLEKMLGTDNPKLFTDHAEETYEKLFAQFDFTRAETIIPESMDWMGLYIDRFLKGKITASEMYTNLFEDEKQ